MDVRALKDKATQLFSRGKFAKAAEAYDEYCNADPKDLQARLRLGDAWMKAGKKDKAVLAYTWAAEGFAREGFLPRAIAASKLVLEIDPSHTGVQKMLADLYAQKSRPGGGRPLAQPPPRPLGGADRAVDLNAPPPPPKAVNRADPSPMTRTDAIEVEAFEIPADDGRSTVGGMAATKGPSPLTRADAIEIEVEDSGPTERRPPEAPPVDIELSVGPPVSGEVEIPIDVGAPPHVDQLPPDLQVPVVQGTSLSPTPQPIVAGQELPPPPPSAPVYELDDVVEEPPRPAPQADPPASSPSGAVYELTVEVPEPAAPPPPPAPAPSSATAAVADVAAAAPPKLPPPPPGPGDGESIVTSSTPAPVAVPPQPPDVIPQPGRAESDPSVSPPGLRPRRSGDSLPPTALPPVQSTPSSSRIWLPPGFGTEAPAGGPAAPEAKPVQFSNPAGSSDLERSLQAFTRFEATPAPVRIPASFTELELEGDSLLHAVESAALKGLADGGAPAVPQEEAMEAPEEPRLEPGALPKIPLFSDLPADAFIALFESCPLRRFAPGDTVIQQGTKGDAFYVICAGSVRVVRKEGTTERELARLEEGAFFGEMALLSEAPRSASVFAADEGTQLLEIGAPVLKDLAARHPSVSTALKKFCRQRLLSNLMQSSALFQPFSRSDRRELVQKFRARDVRKGETLIKEGERSDGLYVVLSGEVEVSVKGRRVAALKEGEIFGEMSLLTRSPATATVSSTRHTSLLRLPREDFEQLIMSHPQILAHVSELTDERSKANAAVDLI